MAHSGVLVWTKCWFGDNHSKAVWIISICTYRLCRDITGFITPFETDRLSLHVYLQMCYGGNRMWSYALYTGARVCCVVKQSHCGREHNSTSWTSILALPPLIFKFSQFYWTCWTLLVYSQFDISEFTLANSYVFFFHRTFPRPKIWSSIGCEC